MTTLLDKALTAEHLILSSAGSHAQQDWHIIIDRKRHDIARTKPNHTVWLLNSNATRPDAVQQLCKDHGARYVIFVSRHPRHGPPKAGPSTNTRARNYSIDGRTWSRLDPALSEVTGRINSGTTGFWFERLEEITNGEIDVRSFSKLNGERLEGFQIHESPYPVRRTGAVGRKGYHVLAVGELGPPFAVWLRV